MVAREVRRILEEARTDLQGLLLAEEGWHRANIRPWHPSRALEELSFGVELPFPSAREARPKADQLTGKPSTGSQPHR